jgi:hypothetical protein
MAGTVVAVFDDNIQAEHAAQALVEDGVPMEDITLVFHGADGASGTTHDDSSGLDQPMLATGIREVEQHDVERPMNGVDEIAPRAIVGFIIGAPLGSLAISTAVFFPNVESYLTGTGHALAGQLLAAGVGGVLGAIWGAVTAGQMPQQAARDYHKDVQSGRTLVTTMASSANAPHFQEILRSHGGRKLGFFPRFLDSLQSLES